MRYSFNADRAALENTSDGFQILSILPIEAAPTSVVTGDFNGDGHSDIASLSVGVNMINVAPGNGDASRHVSNHLCTP